MGRSQASPVGDAGGAEAGRGAGSRGAARGGCWERAWPEAAGPAPAARDGAAGRLGAMPPGPRAFPAPRPGRRAPRPRRHGEPGGHGVAPAPPEEVGARSGLRALARLLPQQHLQAGQWLPAALPPLLSRPPSFPPGWGEPPVQPRCQCVRGTGAPGPRTGEGTCPFCWCRGEKALLGQGHRWNWNPSL